MHTQVVMKTKKRRLFDDAEIVSEGKRSKQEDMKLVQKNYGDGVAWLRGSMIGKGSFGCVFIANLKKPKSRYSIYPPIMAVKSAEVSVSGSIQKEKLVMDNIRGCPNVIKCLGEEITEGENGQMVYNLLLEYGSGGTLAGLIKNSNGKGLPEFDVRRYARSILLGLSHIHNKGYVHCDLKPQNVVLVANGKNGGFTAKIADLGLAKRVKQNKRKNSGLQRRGTPTYSSPEAVVYGVQRQPADIWAVGCIVFEMLTGKPLRFPNQDKGMDEILSCIGDGKESAFISSSISTEARSFLKCCLCRKVIRRLTANMLLDHPFLQGLLEENVNEVDESHELFDINAITSSPLFSEDEDDNESKPEGDLTAMENEESVGDNFHQVKRFPVILSISMGV